MGPDEGKSAINEREIFSLYEKGGLHNHLHETYPFPIPNIKGFSYLSDYECHKTPTLQPLPVEKSKVSL